MEWLPGVRLMYSVTQTSIPEYSPWLPAFSFSSRLMSSKCFPYGVFQTNYLFQNQTHKHVPNVNCRLIQTRQIDTTHMAFKLLHSCLEWEFTFEVGRVFANTVGRKWNGYIWDYGLVVTITMATGFLSHYWDAGKVKELITSEQGQLCLVDAHTYP